MARLVSLGVSLPDPSVQRNVRTHFVGKLSDSDHEFQYRLNAYKMTKNLQGGVTQAQVDELWRYLVAEAREVHGLPATSAKKAKQSSPPDSHATAQTPGNVPKGAGEASAKKAEDGKGGKGKGEGEGQGQRELGQEEEEDRGQPQEGEPREGQGHWQGQGLGQRLRRQERHLGREE